MTKEEASKVTKPVIPENETPEFYNGINGFLDAVKHHNIKFLKVEQVVYDPKQDIVGKYDALAEVDGKLALIDYKTSKGVYSTMLAQVAKYRDMWESEESVDPTLLSKVAIFHFGKHDGSFRFIELDESEISAGLKMFNGLYDAYTSNKVLEKFLKEE